MGLHELSCHVGRSEEKQVEIEELRAEVRRGEQRLRTANRDMKSMQVHGGRSHCTPPLPHPAPKQDALQHA